MFQRIALDVSYGFGRNRSMFLIVVFFIKKRVFRRDLCRIDAALLIGTTLRIMNIVEDYPGTPILDYLRHITYNLLQK